MWRITERRANIQLELDMFTKVHLPASLKTSQGINNHRVATIFYENPVSALGRLKPSDTAGCCECVWDKRTFVSWTDLTRGKVSVTRMI